MSVPGPMQVMGLRQSPFFIATILSVLGHLIFMGSFAFLMPAEKPKQNTTVKVSIQEVEKPPPRPKVPPKKPKKKPLSERKPKEPPKPDTKAVAGLSKETFVDNSATKSAAAGNTLLAPDEGQRLNPDDIGSLEQADLSSDAKIIMSSVVIPKYTDEAIDANLEGTYTVDVYVNEKGEVTSAELTKRIGFGMDERILEAARNARFIPRKDRVGGAIPGWTDVKFRLEIPK